MSEPANPASRLLGLLEHIRSLSHPQSVPARMVWANYLGIANPNDTTTILSRLHSIYGLPAKVRYEIAQIPHISPNTYLRRLGVLERTLADMSINDSMKTLAGEVSEDLLAELQICSDTLSQFRPEPPLPEDLDVEAIGETVQGLIDDVRSADISAPLKEYLLRCLSDIQFALDAFLVEGTTGLARAVESSIGLIARRVDLQGEAKTSRVGQRVLAMIGHLAAALTIVATPLQLPGNLFEPDKEIAHVDIDAEIDIDLGDDGQPGRPGQWRSSGPPNPGSDARGAFFVDLLARPTSR